MTTPDHKRKRSPVDRFRTILSDGLKKEEGADARRSPILNLPKAKPPDARPVDLKPLDAKPANLKPMNVKPTGVKPALFTSKPKPAPKPESGSSAGNNRFLPVFWTVASILSLIVNLILIIVVIFLVRGLGSLDPVSLGSGVLGGLYTNFELMDQAHIKTTIPVQTSIPLNLSIPVQTTTGITLAQDVLIQGAHVRINTALFNIDAPASVTLPAGTALTVGLNFNVPVQTEVPVTLNVPVDIPLQDTDLHAAIVGLQQTLKPIYCMVSPTALTLSGAPVCP
jgi:hypothetical protein